MTWLNGTVAQVLQSFSSVLQDGHSSFSNAEYVVSVASCSTSMLSLFAVSCSELFAVACYQHVGYSRGYIDDES